VAHSSSKLLIQKLFFNLVLHDISSTLPSNLAAPI